METKKKKTKWRGTGHNKEDKRDIREKKRQAGCCINGPEKRKNTKDRRVMSLECKEKRHEVN